jgi:hypothetical protein
MQQVHNLTAKAWHTRYLLSAWNKDGKYSKQFQAVVNIRLFFNQVESEYVYSRYQSLDWPGQ